MLERPIFDELRVDCNGGSIETARPVGVIGVIFSFFLNTVYDFLSDLLPKRNFT